MRIRRVLGAIGALLAIAMLSGCIFVGKGGHHGHGGHGHGGGHGGHGHCD